MYIVVAVLTHNYVQPTYSHASQYENTGHKSHGNDTLRRLNLFMDNKEWRPKMQGTDRSRLDNNLVYD